MNAIYVPSMRELARLRRAYQKRDIGRLKIAGHCAFRNNIVRTISLVPQEIRHDSPGLIVHLPPIPFMHRSLTKKTADAPICIYRVHMAEAPFTRPRTSKDEPNPHFWNH